MSKTEQALYVRDSALEEWRLCEDQFFEPIAEVLKNVTGHDELMLHSPTRNNSEMHFKLVSKERAKADEVESLLKEAAKKHYEAMRLLREL